MRSVQRGAICLDRLQSTHRFDLLFAKFDTVDVGLLCDIA